MSCRYYDEVLTQSARNATAHLRFAYSWKRPFQGLQHWFLKLIFDLEKINICKKRSDQLASPLSKAIISSSSKVRTV